MPQLPDLLQHLFSGLSVNQAADRTGIDPSFMSKLFRGKATPSVENILRIAFATGTHPASLFDVAGQPELATLARSVRWEDSTVSERDVYQAGDAELHSRVQRLIERGYRREIEAALTQLESGWESLRSAFEGFAQSTGSAAAVLSADSATRPADILFRWKCTQPQALELVAGVEKRAEWQAFAYTSQRLTLRLFLKTPASREVRKQAQLAVQLWAAQLVKTY